MTPQEEILVNDPKHPCGFCSLPIPINRTYCNQTCHTAEELLSVFLAVSEREAVMANNATTETVWESCFNPNL